MKRIFMLSLLALPLLGCNDNNANSGNPAGNEEALNSVAPTEAESVLLHQAGATEYATYTSKSAMVIRNANDYADELLKRTTEAPKDVDFSEYTVLLLDMGQRSSGGHSIHMESAQWEEDHIRVRVILQVPGDNCIVTASLTNPFQILKLKTRKDILVTEEINYTVCE
jgi:hypothetical protein